jgi:alkylhydroperoxidase/carboxymuconolactone decarboxylase family protein YurZ
MKKLIKDMNDAREYWLSYYGIKPEQYERLGKYNPDIMSSWTNFRSTTWKTLEEGGHLSKKFKELLAIGIETASGKQHVGHVERAIDNGATVDEIAEVLGICIMLAGMQSYEIGGKDVLKRAEAHAEKLKKSK